MKPLRNERARPRHAGLAPSYPRCLGIALAAAALATGCHHESAATAGEPAPVFDRADAGAQTAPTASAPPTVDSTPPPPVLGGIAPMPIEPADSSGK